MSFIKITLIKNGKQGSFINKIEEVDIAALFDGADIGEIYQLQKIEMTEKEYAKIPEFEGF